MIGTIKSLYHDGRNWWRAFRAIDREQKIRFIVLVLGGLVIYTMVYGMSHLEGRLERQTDMNAALQRLAPKAVEAIRQSCRGRWELAEDCTYFWELREKRGRWELAEEK